MPDANGHMTPEDIQAMQSLQDGQEAKLRALLMRMSPEERAQMFEPYGQELQGLDAQMQQQPHTTGIGALLGGAGNTMAAIGRGGVMKREQADAGNRVNARYELGGQPPMTEDMLRKLRSGLLSGGGQDPFGLPPLTPGGG